MKLYCFLLLIILICLVYDNKLYEGNDHTYDTEQDKTTSYKKIKESDGIFSNLGLDFGVPDPTTLVTGGTKVALKDFRGNDINCDLYENKTCNDTGQDHAISPHSSDWPYGDTDGGNGTKKHCMKCFTCKTGGAFPHSFYARMCDTLAGCYGNPSNYEGTTLPYTYAYNQNDVWKYCSSNNNAMANITCTAQEYGETLMDVVLLAKKPESMACHAEIASLESPAGGLVSGIANIF
jgi:hypothetical protein